MSARVEMTEITGAETMAVLDLAGTEIVARLGPADRPPNGRVARFDVDTRKACLFDPQTEQRIA